MIVRMELAIRGVVQGVGFRPFLFRHAQQHSLAGVIQNRGDHVRAHLEGERENLEAFCESLKGDLPRHARITEIERSFGTATGETGLEIVASEPGSGFGLAPDIATCEKCLQEFQDPRDRRYRYPLISCTDCGPRYTTIESLPYDRASTSFARFEICPDCATDYESPPNRRFHAEGVACPRCGPQIFFSAAGSVLLREPRAVESEARKRLRAGEILAVKGLGGVQIMLDAANIEALQFLRARKRRPHQAFALMVRDRESARRLCQLDENDIAWLEDPSAPIVIVPRKEGALSNANLDLIAPDTDTLGIMLPPTPLHRGLFGDAEYLVATSANRHGEPIALGEGHDSELSGVVDGYLGHDREILKRSDDSVWRSVTRGTRRFRQVWRAGRGYAPFQIPLPEARGKTILALGGELKNTIVLAAGGVAIGSPHVGNLECSKTYRHFEQTVREFPVLLGRVPEVIAVDMHPQYGTSNLGRRLAAERDLPLVEVQHHHAHAAACMLEHGLGEALALVFDGTGFGNDGTFWGGELLRVDYGRFSRLGRLKPAYLPGGDSAVRHPWKQACSRLIETGITVQDQEKLFKDLGVGAKELANFVKVWERLRGDDSVPRTSSAGRLFDSIAALLGLGGREITYEGQAAILLEREAARFREAWAFAPYELPIVEENGLWQVSTDLLIREIAEELVAGRERQWIAARFHASLAESAARLVEIGARATGLCDLVLSGGVFQNQILVQRLCENLPDLRIHEHQRIPPGDGGLAFGQAAVAAVTSRGLSFPGG